MSTYNDLQAQLFDSFTTEAEALDIRQQATAQRAAEIQKKQNQLAEEKKTIDAKLAEAKDLLDELKAEEREALLSRGSVADAVRRAASGRAAAAIRYAMAQVGDSYVYGAAGPNAFDCSGLTMMAWAQAGVGCRTRPAPSTAPARTSPPATCSRVTWSSTTADQPRRRCTSATA